MPVTIKDITFIEGLKCRRGSKIYATICGRFHARRSFSACSMPGRSCLARRPRPELGWKGETTSPAYRHDAQSLEPGADTGRLEWRRGSLRRGRNRSDRARHRWRRLDSDPVRFSGVFGLKPSLGLVPVFPASAVGRPRLSRPDDVDRPRCRPAARMSSPGTTRATASRGIRIVDYVDALANLDLRGLSVAWSRDLGYAAVEPEVADLPEAAAKVFADLGCEIVDDHPDLPDPWPIEHVLWVSAMAGARRDDFEQVRDIMDPGLVELVEMGRHCPRPTSRRPGSIRVRTRRLG